MPDDPDNPLFSTIKLRELSRPFDQVPSQVTSIALVPKGRAGDLRILQNIQPCCL
jgi:hypothetical protein